MKILSVLVCASAAALTGWAMTGECGTRWACDRLAALCAEWGGRCEALPAGSEVSGLYVEARSASVFAGPCHVNGEYDLQGRQALLGFRIEGGAWQGTDLSGVQLAAAVRSEENLAEGAPRSTTVWLDEDLEPERREAALGWLRATHGEDLGPIEVAGASAAVAVDGERFSVDVEGVCQLQGSLLADRSCCTMPESVWYQPVAAVSDVIVGQSEVCRFEGQPAWSYQQQNNVFVGRFD
jgi:hypothetical protein